MKKLMLILVLFATLFTYIGCNKDENSVEPVSIDTNLFTFTDTVLMGKVMFDTNPVPVSQMKYSIVKGKYLEDTIIFQVFYKGKMLKLVKSLKVREMTKRSPLLVFLYLEPSYVSWFNFRSKEEADKAYTFLKRKTGVL